MDQETELIANRYQVVRLLGEGGMGKVFQVQDTLEHKTLALKILSEKIASEAAFLQFKQEFWFMTKLRHPHIVHVYEYGVLDDNSPYITMELVEGQELSELGQIDAKLAYRILIQATRALGFIHSRQLIHSDIKPDNIRIQPDGNVKLMDFGLMQPLGKRSNGQLTGTVAYMPPEMPQQGILNESSDFYSLGIVAYEMLTGVQPFIGTTVLEVVKAHIKSNPAPPRTFREEIPIKLEALVLKMMARDQAHRYRNAAELLADLARASGETAVEESEEEKLSYLNSHVLVGRDAELDQLKLALEDMQAQDSRSVFVGAPAGVGKSRLVEEFKIHVQLSELLFCQGQCVEQGMESFAPMVQALQGLLPLTPSAFIQEQGAILAHLVPRIARQDIVPQPGFDLRNQKIQLYEAVVNWLKRVAAIKPLVLFIDDLHWSDMATLDLMNYCIRELVDARVLILGSFRDDEVAANSPLWQTVEEGESQLLTLSVFTEAHVQELIQKMLRDVELKPDFIQYFYGATSGNAFFVREMLRYLMEENLLQREHGFWVIPANYTAWQLPTSIGDTIKQRLKRLSKPAIRLVKMISVVGKRIPLPLLELLSQAAENDLFAILEELAQRQFVVREKASFHFPHDRVRETLYASMDEAFRRPIHQKVAQWYEQNGAPASILAYHFQRGEDQVKAMRYLIQAGEESSVRMEATQLMHQGLQILETLDTLEDQQDLLLAHRRKLAWVSYMIHPFICIETNEKLLQSLQEQGESLEAQIEFESILISSYTMVGQNRKALDKAEALLQQLQPETIPYALILFGRLNAWLTRGEFRQLRAEMETAATILKPHINELSRQMVWAYAFCCFIREDAIAWLGEPVGQDEYAEIPRRVGEDYDFLDLIFWSYYPEVVRNSLIGKYHAIRLFADEIFTLIKKMGRPIQHENRFQLCLAFAAIEHGDLAEGERYAEKIVALGERMQNPHQQASGKILQGMIAESQHHWVDAVEFYAEAVALSRKSETDQLLPALYRLAGVHLRQREIQRAEVLTEEAHALATSLRLENPYHQIQTWRLKAQLAIAQNLNSDQIIPCFEQAIALAETTQNPLQLGHSQFALARYLVDEGQLEPAQSHLDAAAAAYQEITYSLRQVDELRQWIQANLTPPASAEPSSASASAHAVIPPNQAQELGYRLMDMIKEVGLPQLRLGNGSEDEEALNSLSERLEKVERVNQFSQLIMRSLDLRLVLRNIVDYVVDIAQADRGILMVRDEQGELSAQVVRHREGEEPDENRLIQFSKTFTQKVLKTGESLWVQDAQSDPEFARQASVMALDLRTIICVPLKREKQIIGLLYLDRQAIHETFSAQDLELVESMGTFATISLINARLHAQLKERNQHLQMLNELSRALSTTIDFSELLSLVLKFSLDITQAEWGYIFINKVAQQEPQNFHDLECQASRNRQGRPLPEIQVSRTSIEKVLAEKTPLSIVDMQDDEDMAAQKSVMALELKSVLCVPIYGKEQAILGVVYLSSQAVNYCFTPRDLSLIESLVTQVGLDIENRHLMELRKKQELMDQELSLARNIQSSMLPDYVPDIPHLDIIGYSQSADAVGGDYYDYFKISDYEFGLAIGDVNGHGISASLLMSMAKSCLFVQGKIDPSVLAMMTALNAMVFGGVKERLFMTFVYSVFNLDQNTVTLSSAGHHLPYHYQAQKGELVPINIRPTYPLGVREQARFNEITLTLEPDDILVYYTDGIIEAHNAEGEEFGFERLEALIVEHHALSPLALKEVLLSHYHQWIAGQPDEDDMTLVVVKARASEEPPAGDKQKKEKKKLKTGFLTLINR